VLLYMADDSAPDALRKLDAASEALMLSPKAGRHPSASM
jgi:hypothetical protein